MSANCKITLWRGLAVLAALTLVTVLPIDPHIQCACTHWLSWALAVSWVFYPAWKEARRLKQQLVGVTAILVSAALIAADYQPTQDAPADESLTVVEGVVVVCLLAVITAAYIVASNTARKKVEKIGGGYTNRLDCDLTNPYPPDLPSPPVNTNRPSQRKLYGMAVELPSTTPPAACDGMVPALQWVVTPGSEAAPLTITATEGEIPFDDFLSSLGLSDSPEPNYSVDKQPSENHGVIEFTNGVMTIYVAGNTAPLRQSTLSRSTNLRDWIAVFSVRAPSDLVATNQFRDIERPSTMAYYRIEQ